MHLNLTKNYIWTLTSKSKSLTCFSVVCWLNKDVFSYREVTLTGTNRAWSLLQTHHYPQTQIGYSSMSLEILAYFPMGKKNNITQPKIKDSTIYSAYCGCYAFLSYLAHCQAVPSHQTQTEWTEARLGHKNANSLLIKHVQWSSLPPPAINLQEETPTVTDANLSITDSTALWTALIRAYQDVLTEGGGKSQATLAVTGTVCVNAPGRPCIRLCFMV